MRKAQCLGGAAVALNQKISRYAAGMVVGPAAATTWNLDSSWDTEGAELLKLTKPAHIHYWKSVAFFAGVEKAPDGCQAAANPDSVRLIARQLSRAADYVIGAHYLHHVLGNDGLDGDRGDEPLGQENQIDMDSFLQQLDADWK